MKNLLTPKNVIGSVLVLIIFGWLSWVTHTAMGASIRTYQISQIFCQLEEIKDELKDLNQKVERLLK